MDGKITITADASQLRSEMQRASDAVRGFEGDAGQRLIATLQEQVKTFGMTNDQLLQYKAGMLGVGNEAQQLIARLQKMKDAQAGFAGAAAENVNNMHRMGNSAAQTANAMRMVPAQLSDITTQLMGGQNPLLIMVEQGGQMRDMFGGFGPMFRGLASMITPAIVGFGAMAAAIGAMIFGYERGAAESERFNASLRLTGNYAGITEGQFNEMARSIAASTETGVGTAREALQQMVSGGRFTGDTLEAVGRTALTFAQLSGEAASKVIDDFAGMADGVTKWAEKQNEKYHFLTLAQYEHIAALEKEGSAQEAMQATMEAFNQHLSSQTENLSLWESAWRSAKNAMSEFWDTLKNAGRDATIDDQINAAKASLANLQDLAKEYAGTGRGSRAQEKAQGVQALLERLQAQKAQQEATAKQARAEDDLHAKAIQAKNDNDEIKKSLQSRVQQGEELIARYKKDQEALAADHGKVDSADVQQTTIDAIRKKYAEQPHGNGQMQQWEAELSAIKLAEEQKALSEGHLYQMSKQEELSFWQQKRALTTDGTREQTAVERKATDLGLAMLKDKYNAEQAGLKLSMQAAKDSYQQRAAIMQKYVQNVGQEYGQESAQYKVALQQQKSMRLQHDAEMRQIAQMRVADERDNALAVIDQQQRIAQMDYDLGLITRTQLLELQRGYITERMRLELQAADDTIALYKADTVEYEKALSKKKAIERKYSALLAQNGTAQAAEQGKPQASIMEGAKSAFTSNVTSMVMVAKNFQQTMGGIAQSVGQIMIREMVTKVYDAWVAGWVKKLATNLGFLGAENAQQVGAAAVSTGITAKTATTEIGANAAAAGSGAAKSVAGIPGIGPILALAAMASIFAAVSGMSKNVRSASRGFDIPHGLNPMTQLHEDEMVLPAHIANPLREDLRQRGRGLGSRGGESAIHVHLNATYQDQAGIKRLFMDNPKHIVNAIKQAMRDAK